MTSPDGPLVDADEAFTHQIAETHAHVLDADRSWTEKVCAMAASRDGTLQVGFGVGKYPNRNVFDGYASVSRGREQWTVRASRRLSDEPDRLSVGPLSYAVLEPYHGVRFACEANDEVPVAFEWVFEAAVPAHLEDRDRSRSRRGYRLESDLLRYHQVGVASGWVEVDGRRAEITPEGWFSTRDHSWGVRHDVGLPPTDIEASGGLVPGVAFRFSWSPMLLERADGTRYAVHHQHRHLRAFGYEELRTEGTIEEPDGTVQRVASLRSDLRFDPANRRVLGGTIVLIMADGSERPISVRALGHTGVHLGLGLYMGLDGHHHGEWRGALSVEGEYVRGLYRPRGGPAHPSDPGHGRRRRRSRRRGLGVGQPPDHGGRSLAGARPGRRVLLRLTEGPDRVARCRRGVAAVSPRCRRARPKPSSRPGAMPVRPSRRQIVRRSPSRRRRSHWPR